MIKKIYRLTILLVGILGFTLSLHAITVSGYIITENSDTIGGTIRLNKFDQRNGSLIISGFDEESLYSKVSFKGTDDKKFHSYEPGSILGFGFSYKKVIYIFKSFTIQRNSLVRKEREQKRFLCLTYQGALTLFKDIEPGVYNGNNFAMNNVNRYVDLFLFQSNVGLVKVEKISGLASLQALLRRFNCQEEFLNNLTEISHYWDIMSVLLDYDAWLAKADPSPHQQPTEHVN